MEKKRFSDRLITRYKKARLEREIRKVEKKISLLQKKCGYMSHVNSDTRSSLL